MFSEKMIQNSHAASLNSESNIIFDKVLKTTYDQFLQKSAHSSASSLTSLTFSFTLNVTPFSLKVQVEAFRYDTLYLQSLWYKTAQKEC